MGLLFLALFFFLLPLTVGETLSDTSVLLLSAPLEEKERGQEGGERGGWKEK